MLSTSDNVGKCRPYPWLCPSCGKKEVAPVSTEYTAEVRHDGRLHTLHIDDLELPTCRSCGQTVFSTRVNERISDALRSELRLLTPGQIRAAVSELGQSQKEIAERLGVAEATLSRWVTGSVIQSRAMDNLLRVYFGIPQVRYALLGEGQERDFGATLVAEATTPGDRTYGEEAFAKVVEVYGRAAILHYVSGVAARHQVLRMR